MAFITNHRYQHGGIHAGTVEESVSGRNGRDRRILHSIPAALQRAVSDCRGIRMLEKACADERSRTSGEVSPDSVRAESRCLIEAVCAYGVQTLRCRRHEDTERGTLPANLRVSVPHISPCFGVADISRRFEADVPEVIGENAELGVKKAEVGVETSKLGVKKAEVIGEDAEVIGGDVEVIGGKRVVTGCTMKQGD